MIAGNATERFPEYGFRNCSAISGRNVKVIYATLNCDVHGSNRLIFIDGTEAPPRADAPKLRRETFIPVFPTRYIAF